jgi:proliferating cell nuclear antigen
MTVQLRLTPADVGAWKNAFMSISDMLIDGNLTFIRNDGIIAPNKKKKVLHGKKTYRAAGTEDSSSDSDDDARSKTASKRDGGKEPKDNKDPKDAKRQTRSSAKAKSETESTSSKKKGSKRGGLDSAGDVEKAKYEHNGGMVRLHEINSTKSVMIFLRFPAIEFHEFYCAQKTKTISLNFQTLNRFLKRIDKDDDVMTFILRSDKPDHLIIENRSKANGGKFSHYEVPLIEVNRQKIKYDDVEFDSIVTMPSAQLQSLCKSITGFSEYIEIKCVGKQAQFYCKGENGVVRETLGKPSKKKGGDADATEKKAIVQGIFEARYIAAASKCMPLSPTVDILLKNDWPVVLAFSFSHKSKICFWVSPVAVKPHESNSNITQADLSDLSDDDMVAKNTKQEVVKKKAVPRVSRS